MKECVHKRLGLQLRLSDHLEYRLHFFIILKLHPYLVATALLEVFLSVAADLSRFTGGNVYVVLSPALTQDKET